MDSDIKQKPGGSLSPSKKDPEMFLHVADPVGVVGLRRGRLTVNWQGQSRGRGWVKSRSQGPCLSPGMPL